MNLPEGARLRADLRRALQDAGEEPSARRLEALSVHLRLLAKWNPRYGLTRIERWDEILDRHVKESLLPLRWVGPDGRLLDIGSGNGFPAIPILVCRPRLEGTLVERSDRKALFLDAVVREAGLQGIQIAVKDLGSQAPSGEHDSGRDGVLPAAPAAHGRSTTSRKRPGRSSAPTPADSGGGSAGGRTSPRLYDYVISRATLSPDRLVSLSRSWSRPGGRIFIYAGESLAADGLRELAREPIPGRKNSFLWVFEVGE